MFPLRPGWLVAADWAGWGRAVLSLLCMKRLEKHTQYSSYNEDDTVVCVFPALYSFFPNETVWSI